MLDFRKNYDKILFIVSFSLRLLITTSAVAASATEAVFVTNARGYISEIDPSTNRVSTIFTLGDGPDAVAVTPNGQFVYVANQNSNNVSVIQTSNNMAVANISVGISPDAVAVTPNGQG